MSDNGLAALAAALNRAARRPQWSCTVDHGGEPCPDKPLRHAAAILGERGVFLPDGLDAMLNKYDLNVVAPLEVEIARLRAALDGLVEAGEEYLTDNAWSNRDALRAALVTAKETP